ncbi:MAG: hypothetical protein ACR2FM_05870 [Candidatus Saccharimonadales bacterium]
MKYNTHSNYLRRKRLIKRLLFLGVAIVLIGGYFGGKYIINTYFQEETIITEAPIKNVGYFEPSTQIFSSPYFQLQATKNWAQDINASTANKYIYRSYDGPLIERELTIYVNNIPDDIVVTRVLPALVDSGSKSLTLSPTSEHCGKGITDKKQLTQTLTVSGVTFKCNVDDNNFTVLVGKAGGTTSFDLLRPDGTTAKYAIYYRDVTAKPSSTELEQMLKTFQTR